jgi:hypothetical protein
MSTQKRRIIWMDDETWAMLGQVVAAEQRRANGGFGQRITPSLVIRDCLDRGHFRALREAESVRFGRSSPAPKGR